MRMKKVFSILVCLCMLLQLVPVHVHAEADATAAPLLDAVAQVTRKNAETVYCASLQEAILEVFDATAEDKAVVTLLTGVDGGVSIGSGVFTLDLNGNAIESNGTALNVYNSGTIVTITDNSSDGNGYILATGEYTYGVDVSNNGKLYVQGGAITGEYSGVTAFGGYIEISDGKISSACDGVSIINSTLKITGGEIIGNIYGDRYGYGVAVNGGDTVTISGGAIEGYQGIYAYGIDDANENTVTITGGTIEGESQGVQVQQCSTVNVNGGKICGGSADINFQMLSTKVTLGVEDGAYEGATFPDGIMVTSDVVNDTLKEILAEGVAYYNESDEMVTQTKFDEPFHRIEGQGDITVKKIVEATVSMNGTETDYGTLSAAFDAVKNATAADEAVVKLLGNVTESAGQAAGVFTLDLNGKTWTVSGSSPLDISSSAVLTIQDSSSNKTGQILADENNECLSLIRNNGTLNITGGIFTAEKGQFVLIENNNTLSITGGTFTANGLNATVVANISDSTMTMEGGDITGFTGISNDGTAILKGGTVTASYNALYNGSSNDTSANTIVSGATLITEESVAAIASFGTLTFQGGQIHSESLEEDIGWYGGTITMESSAECDGLRIFNYSDDAAAAVIGNDIILPAGYHLRNYDKSDDKVGNEISSISYNQRAIVTSDHHWKCVAESETITAECKDEGCGKMVTITLRAPENLTFDANAKSVGVEVLPEGVLTDIPAALTDDSWTNAGEHTATLEYHGAKAMLTFTIAPKSITAGGMNVAYGISQWETEYDGQDHMSHYISVSDGDRKEGWMGWPHTLVKGTEFEVYVTLEGERVEEIKYAGVYTITIKGIGNYGDEASKNFTVKPCPHELNNTNTDDGDCTTAFKCSNCRGVITPAQEIHDPDEDGNCTTVAMCKNDGCTQIATPAKAHSFTNKASDELESAATCEKAVVYYVQCDNVGCTVVSDSVTVSVGDALGHTWGEPTYDFAADGSSCRATHVCANDETHTETADATITSAETTSPTCEEKGKTTYTANFTESWAETQTKVVENISATGHTWGETTYAFAENGKTCTATRTCNRDSAHVENVTANISSEVKTPATCEEKGWRTYTATFTESWAATQTKEVQDIPATDHTWSVTYAWSDDGKTCIATRVCGNDPAHNLTAEATIKSEITKQPTTTALGETTYTATFDADWTTTQTKTVADIPMLNEVDIPTISGGNVLVNNPTPATGDKVTITITPETGKEVDEVMVITNPTTGDGFKATKKEEGKYVYIQPEGDVKISVTMKDIIYTPTVTQPESGEVEVKDENGDGSHTYKEKVTITVDPDPGMEVDQITITDENENPVDYKDNGDGTYTYTQPAGNVTIRVTMKDIIYTPTVTQPESGKVEIEEGDHKYGDEITVTVKPEDGMEVDQITIMDENGTLVDYEDNGDGTYTYTQPVENVTIRVTMKKIEYKNEIPKPIGGTVTTDKETPTMGDDVTITVKPDPGKEVAGVVVKDEDGKEVSVTKNPDGTYTYKQPIGKVTITVTMRTKYHPSYDEPVEKPVEDNWQVICRKLNVRSGAGTQFERIGSLTRGMCVEGEMLDNGWVKITLDDGTVGYVCGLYVEECEHHDEELPESAVVICRKLNVRTGAGTQFKRIGQLSRGEEVTVLDNCNGWYEIVYDDGTAWICAKYVG